MNSFKKELLFKILVVGDFGVGKTSIVKRYVEDDFTTSYKVTIGADFALKRIQWNENTKIDLQIWDIAGHERFGSLTNVYYRHAVAAAVVFDLTRPETFNSVEKWIADIRNKVTLPNGGNIPLILLANKGDMTTDTLPEKINQFCIQNGIVTWIITSAKENIHIDSAMNILVKTVLDNFQNKNQKEVTKPPIKLTTTSPQMKLKKFCFF